MYLHLLAASDLIIDEQGGAMGLRRIFDLVLGLIAVGGALFQQGLNQSVGQLLSFGAEMQMPAFHDGSARRSILS